MAEKYKITGQRQTTVLGGAGTFTEVMEVTFQVTDSSTVGRVNIPLDRYNPERVAATIEDYVDKITAVESL